MGWRRIRWIAGFVLLVLGLFDVPDQIQKVQNALTVVTEWIGQKGLDQNGWRWAFVVSAALLVLGPEGLQRLGAAIERRAKPPTLKALVPIADSSPSAYLPAWARTPSMSPPPPPRVFVGEGVSPKYLIELYNTGITTMQKDAHVANFIGKWMRVTGTVSDIHADPPILEFAENRGPILSSLDMWFEDSWKERLAILAVGSRLTVDGQVDRVDGISVRLRKCEIVPSTEAP